jgi:hypothetical protein
VTPDCTAPTEVRETSGCHASLPATERNRTVKAPTIYDVAKQAGVSHQTVSRYLSDSKASVRRRGRRWSEPSPIWTTGRTRRPACFGHINRIGVIADRMSEGGPARILAGASALALEYGYVLDILAVAGVFATAQTKVVFDALQELRLGAPWSLTRAMHSRTSPSRDTSRESARPTICSRSDTAGSGTSPAPIPGSHRDLGSRGSSAESGKAAGASNGVAVAIGPRNRASTCGRR